MSSKLPYIPKEVTVKLCEGIELPCIDDHEKDMLRVQFSTETKIANMGIRFEKDKFTHTTSVDKINSDQLADYTLRASQLPTRGYTVVTNPNGMVGIQGTQPYPATKREMEAEILDNFSGASHFIDHVHPKIIEDISKKKNTHNF